MEQGIVFLPAEIEVRYTGTTGKTDMTCLKLANMARKCVMRRCQLGPSWTK